MNNILKSLSLLAGLSLAGAAFAGMSGPDGHGKGHHRGPGPGGGIYMRELRELDLSEAQKTQIKDLSKASRERFKESHQAMRDLHQRYRVAIPGTPEFRTLTGQMADAASAEAGERVRQQADLRTQVYGVLTAEQKKKLAVELAKAPEPKPERAPPR